MSRNDDNDPATAALLAAYAPVAPPPELLTPSRNIKQALSRLDEQSGLLLKEARGRIPFHDTLRTIIERMAGR